MSLVAYASSGESDGEENEDDIPTTAAVVDKTAVEKEASLVVESNSAKSDVGDEINNRLDGNISDSDSDIESRNNDNSENNVDSKDVLSLLKGLPEPKGRDTTSTSDGASTSKEKQEDALEEEVKPKLSQIKDAPKPPARKKVIITIPSLDKNDSGDEDQPKKKAKLAPSKGKSGLFSLLPDPIHTSVKATNRALIPHTLTKKPVQKPATESKSLSSTKPPVTVSKDSQMKGLASYSSDSEDSEGEESNFFSLGGSSEPDKTTSGPMLPQPAQSASTFSRLSLPPPKNPISDNADNKTVDPNIESISSNEMNISSSSSKTEEVVEDSENFESVLPNQDAPLSFKSSIQNAPLSFKSGPWNAVSGSQQRRGVQGYGYPSANYSNTVSGQEAMEFENTSTVQGDQDFTKDEEFLKMQGKRRRHEDINIVDINADDFIGDSALELTKSMSEETPVRSHSKKDGPTSQQKRKHQITYLAFQAKEREIELKNTWSQNKMTKKQTQAKYGF